MKLLDRFSAAFSDAIAWIYFAVFLIVTYDVVARYVFNAPTVWGSYLGSASPAFITCSRARARFSAAITSASM